jgi:hypothetical protein
MKTALVSIPTSPRKLFRFGLLAAVLLALAAPTAQAHWPNTNATKWVQFPDSTYNGLDIWLSSSLTLADDFKCILKGPVTDIHLWTSWLNNVPDQNAAFTLSIWSDVPSTTGTPSHPGSRLWTQIFGPGKYQAQLWLTNVYEGFWNPDPPPGSSMGSDSAIYQYNFYPTNPFVQNGSLSTPQTYWLCVSVTGTPQPVGWKTSTNHWNDDAAFSHMSGTNVAGDWQPIENAIAGNNLDLSFTLTTAVVTNPPPPVDTNSVKYSQLPCLTSVRDPNCTNCICYELASGPTYWMADDFLCTNAGPVTDIHLWGSWLNDQPDPNPAFSIFIFSDVPADPTVSGSFSHPGDELWGYAFGPGQYAAQPVRYPDAEGFLDPVQGLLGMDYVLWQYDFYITNSALVQPFLQQGSPAAPTNYWLAVNVAPQFVTNLFGWKISTNHYGDAAVFAAGPSGWQIAYLPTGGTGVLTCDMAFILTTQQPATPTNDFGDAPDSLQTPRYPTLLAHNGARHTVVPGVHLGNLIDAEADGQPNATATGDDLVGLADEDGVVFAANPITPGQWAQVTVTASVPGFLNAWLDFNANSSWADAGEAIFVNQPVNAGANVLSFRVPPTAAGGSNTFARFRYTTNMMVPPAFTGLASNGEVEDYMIGIASPPLPPPPPPPETNSVKYLQWPDPNGLDVLATTPIVLADDYLCTNTGPVTDIHVWCSWLGDYWSTNATFWLGIWSDVPRTNTLFASHPGSLIWSNSFSPGQYGQYFSMNANELFYDPSTTNFLGADQQMHYYTFYPTNPLLQQGTAAKPVTYWLSVQASLPNGELFGWKTSTNHWNDAAVYGVTTQSWSGTVANWAMDEGTGTTVHDSTVYANNGTFVGPAGGQPTWTTGHSSLWALAFPGGDYQYYGAGVSVPHSTSLDITGPFAIQAWIKAYPGQHYYTIVDKMFMDWGIPGKGFTFYLTGGQLRFSIYTGRGPAWDMDLFGTTDLRDSQWHLVECGFDGAAVYVKADGREEGRAPWTNAPASINTPLGIGERLCGWGGYMPFFGIIDSVTITTTSIGAWQWTELWDPRYGDHLDMAFKITTSTNATLDFGDAPSPFPTLLANDGARHVIVPAVIVGTNVVAPGVMLGTRIDGEWDGQPNATATGDDNNGLADEDGVVLAGGLMVPGDWATTYVIASTNGYLSAWVDFQADGSWATPGDQIFTNLALPAGTNTLCLYVPLNAAQGSNVFARFRFSTMQITNFTGLALDGEVEDYMWYVAEVDYGDAPDPPFPTLHASNGARHWRAPNVQLGALWDPESDGQPNATATGDDLANLRDEDGVQLLTPLLSGKPATIRVTPSVPNGFLSAWIDFGADGSWDTPGDQIFSGFLLNAAGPTNLTFNVPPTAAAGSNVFARFRFSTARFLILTYTNLVGPPGTTPNGEVEDYMWHISQFDFGDAPDPPYPTWLTNNGAYHLIMPGFCLGTNVSGEWDGQPNATATGDLYDDGVFFVTPLTLSSQACVNVFLTAGANGGKLDAWIDFNQNGTWDAGEQIFTSQALLPGLNANLCFTVPANAALGQTFARFRLSSAGGLSPTGYASDGEVEDYLVRITQRPLATNCVITNIFFQSMYYGWNEPSVYAFTNIAADDWVCTTTNPVTTIRWWGSFLSWQSNTPPALPLAFNIAIWDDVPAMQPGGFSHPGQVLWVIECTNYTWQFAGWDFDPRAQTNETCFRFEQQLALSEWFYQTNRPSGSNIYWISVAAMWPQGTEPPNVYGWKTRTRATNSPAPDVAVRIFNPTAPYLGALYIQGEPIYWPDQTKSWDLAFELVSSYSETVTKWEQPPDLSSTGIDVNDTSYDGMNPPPCLLADDFQCHSTGPLTDITIWGSWTNDWETPQNLWFTLSIHSDIPAKGTTNSMPGQLLWQQTFLPGQYLYQLVQLPYQLYEGWLTPPMNYFFPADHACFQVDFHVQTNAFVQTNGTIYWLDVQAHLPPAAGQPTPAFGWKTSTLHFNDDAVWVNATEPYNTNAWTDLHYPPQHQYYPGSIDLAFRLSSVESVYQLKWSQPPVPSVTNRYVTVEWNAETGIQYQLLATTDLDHGTNIVWTSVGPIVVGPGHSMSDANASALKRFYRVWVP